MISYGMENDLGSFCSGEVHIQGDSSEGAEVWEPHLASASQTYQAKVSQQVVHDSASCTAFVCCEPAVRLRAKYLGALPVYTSMQPPYQKETSHDFNSLGRRVDAQILYKCMCCILSVR